MVTLIGRFALVPSSNGGAGSARPESDAACCRRSFRVGATCLFWLLAATFLSGPSLPAMGTQQEKDSPAAPTRNDKPSTERREAGKFTSKGESLVRRTKDGAWERVPINGSVSTGEPLVSLPGYRSELRLNSDVNLLLWGSVPELRLPLLESAVTLHRAPTDLDADLTLQRGRVYLTNRKEKGSARVRLRFWKEEVWDVTLDEPGGMIGAELFSGYPPDGKFSSGAEPVVVFVLYVAKGKAEVKAGFNTFGDLKAPPGRALFYWNNKGKLEGPLHQEKAIPDWDPTITLPRERRDLVAAREELAARLARRNTKVETVLQEVLASDKAADRALAVRGLAAIDRAGALVDALGDAEHPDVRQEAFLALRNWIGRGKEQAARLYDRKKKSGILADKRFRADQAETILDLLDGIPEEALQQPELYEALIAYLKHRRLEVRELASRHLRTLVPEGRKIKYDAAASKEQIARGYEEWKKLIPSGKLPPAPPPKPERDKK